MSSPVSVCQPTDVECFGVCKWICECGIYWISTLLCGEFSVITLNIYYLTHWLTFKQHIIFDFRRCRYGRWPLFDRHRPSKLPDPTAPFYHELYISTCYLCNTPVFWMWFNLHYIIYTCTHWFYNITYDNHLMIHVLILYLNCKIPLYVICWFAFRVSYFIINYLHKIPSIFLFNFMFEL